MRRTERQKRSLRFLQVVSLLVIALVGCLLVAKKVSAQPQRTVPTPSVQLRVAARPVATAPTAVAAKASATPTASAAPSTGAASTATALPPPSPSSSATAASSPIDYADVQTDADFPADLSEEERASIGTGKVPIHREGPFRSPFAHPKFGGPTTAKVGLVIQEVREYSIQTGSFEAEFYLSLTGDKDLPKLEPIFTNGHEVDLKVLADTPTFKLYRVSGKFVSAVDLREYPFDTQKLAIELEDQTAGVDQLIYVPDQTRTSLDEGFGVASFGVASIGAHAYKHAYPTRFDRDDLYVSRYKFVLGLDRFATSAAFSVFVPAYIIVLISLIGLWVPASELEVRSNAGAPMLAAAVLFHYSLISALPATGYLTHADKLMLGVYISLLMNMLTTWVFLVVDEERKEVWFKRFRVWVPPLTVVVMVVSSIV
jgi:hypothetical protein